MHSIFTSNVFVSIRCLAPLLYADSAVPWFQLHPPQRQEPPPLQPWFLTHIHPTALTLNASCRMNQAQALDWGILKRNLSARYVHGLKLRPECGVERWRKKSRWKGHVPCWEGLLLHAVFDGSGRKRGRRQLGYG